MTETIKAGSTSRSINLKITNSTTHEGQTGLVYNTTGLTIYSQIGVGAPAVVTLVSQTVGGAWVSGGFVEQNSTYASGIYRFDIPDAIIAPGADQVYFFIRGTGIDDCDVAIQLVADDPLVSAYEYQSVTGAGSTTTSIVLDSTASTVDDYYTNGVLLLSGFGARIISGYTGSTQTATVAAFNSAPGAGVPATVIPQDIAALTESDVADAIWNALAASYTTTGTLGALLTLIRQILGNRRETNPGTGVQTVYADDGVTPLLTGDLWNDVAGTVPYNGSNTINRADELA